MSKRAAGRGERPILFNGEMVRAILDGRKTETRRLVKWPAWVADEDKAKLALQRPATGLALYKDGRPAASMTCPFGEPGHLLWVRETWGMAFVDSVPADRRFTRGGTWGQPARPEREPCVLYRADGGMPRDAFEGEAARWTPSIHMPRWASRILLRVEEVRVERVQSIDEAGAMAEGVTILAPEHQSARGEFALLWDAVYGNSQANPWVWVVRFSVLESQP